MKKFFEKFYVVLIFVILYAPIMVLVALSFNSSESPAVWEGFTLEWYSKMFGSSTIMDALKTTLLIACVSAGVSTVFGTAACVGIEKLGRRRRSAILGITNIPMLNADIVTGIALMLLFLRFMRLGLSTVLISHITFSLPYVVLSVMPKLRSRNKSTYEAALDLGASPVRAFFTIVLPEIFPAVLTGFLLSFTMSLDDFVITYFTKSPDINTLSTMVNTMRRRGIKPELYALSTIMFLTILIILFIVNRVSDKKEEKKVRI